MSENNQTSFDARVVLRPRSLDETFDLAIAYFRETVRDFRRLYIVFTIGITAVIVGASVAFDFNVGTTMAVAFIIVPFYERVVTVYAGRHLFHNSTSIFAAIKAVLRRSVFLFFHTAVIVIPAVMIAMDDWTDEPVMGGFGVMLAIGWILFVLPSHLHLTEVLLLEQLPTRRGMRRARVLLAYRFGRALGSLVFSGLVRGCIVAMTYFGLSFLLGFVLQFQSIADHIGIYFAVLGYVIGAPYVALARLFDYVDARTRREGWDIQVRFNAIAQRSVREEAERMAA